jgi:cob(I)alamin adenosyltransferase
MANRLTQIATRTGDDGSTGLGDGSRTPKDSLRIDAMGEVDELNALLGRLLAHALPELARACLIRIQHELFELGAELCLPGQIRILDSQVERLERELDSFNGVLAPLREFILPGGHASAADAHVARTVCRRAERRLIALMRSEGGNGVSQHYLNRLSDFLFVLARWLNRAAGDGDVLWQPEPPESGGS